MKRYLFILTILLQSSTALAQLDFGLWYTHYATFRIAKSRFSIYYDGNHRFFYGTESAEYYVLRPGVQFQLKENMTVALGYAYSGYATGWDWPEHRTWQQFGIAHSAGGIVRLEHRGRLEQRYRKKVLAHDYTYTGDWHVSHRLRYQVRGLMPFSMRKDFTKGMYVALQNEIFFNLNHNPAVHENAGLDQNRIFIGPGYRINRNFDVELGFQYQYMMHNVELINDQMLQISTYLRL